MNIPAIFWKTNKIDCLLLNSEINRQWFSGFSSSYGFILIWAQNKKAQYFLDERYFYEASKVVKNCQILKLKDFEKQWASIKGIVGCEKDLNWMNAEQLKKINNQISLTLVNMQELRMIKTEKEIKNIEFICKITSKVWKKVEAQISKNHTEDQVKLMIIQEFLNHGISELAFEPIVSSGARSEFIHTKSKNKKVQNHVLCDFGGRYRGYNSDFTRVAFLNHNEKINQNWKLIKTLQKKIIDVIKPGEKISTLVKISSDFYKLHDKKEKHALGHGIGLEVHELPNISSLENVCLMENMILTIEPGIYEKNLGGVRIEDVILVTKTGCRVLTK